ncbi:Uncharacterized protein dnl_51490 [Desulfonema limicola]|uniref:ATP-binding protein n=1 Tax=Desulfonema limicola TaxID=45656 RepID=A0A975GIS6_9BACT|nr:hypothetical protein [Desulfonema limicola]QTA82766.1 Uncharacterized protein dnl_51490 [Desulfonema limicola]
MTDSLPDDRKKKKTENQKKPDSQEEKSKKEAKPKRPKAKPKLSSQMIMEIGCKSTNFFHTPTNDAYVEIVYEEHKEVYPVNSSDFRNYLSYQVYKQIQCMTTKNKLDETIINLEGKARFEGLQHEVYLRYAEANDCIYVDIGNDKREQVEISKDGYKVISSNNSPVHFVRKQGMLPLSLPVDGGSIDKLRDYINFKEPHEFTLVIAWIIAALNPDGPFPILIIQAEQGSGKSMTARLLRDLIDPSSMSSRSLTGSERDLAISATHSWVLNFDNASKINDDKSDILCRFSTGGGFAKRTLFTNDGEMQINVKRPIIINGIPDDLASRHDLADRAISIHLDSIDDDKRLTEKEILKKWEQDRPEILGAFYKGVSAGIQNRGSIELASLPRMADFATKISEAEPGLGLKQGTFMEAYNQSRQDIIDDAIDADLVANAIIELMYDRRGKWSGTATELCEDLEKHVSRNALKSSSWPKQHNAMSRRLTRIMSFLRAKGINIERIKKRGSRIINITEVRRAR